MWQALTGQIVHDEFEHSYQITGKTLSTHESTLYKTADGKILRILNANGPKELMERMQCMKNCASLSAIDDVSIKPQAFLLDIPGSRLGYVASNSFKQQQYVPLTDYCRFEGSDQKLEEWFYKDNTGVSFRLKIGYSLAKSLTKIHAAGLCLASLSPEMLIVDVQKLKVILMCPEQICSSILKPAESVSSLYTDPLVACRKMMPSSVSDTYTFATILFQMFSLCHPFAGGTFEPDRVEQQRYTLAHDGFPYIGANNQDNYSERFEITEIFIPPELKQMFDRTFGDGLHDPSWRPSLHEYGNACLRAFNRLLVCNRSICRREYSYEPGKACPFCGDRPKAVPILKIYRDIKTSSCFLNMKDAKIGFEPIVIKQSNKNYHVLHPGENNIAKSALDSPIGSDTDKICVQIVYDQDTESVSIYNKLSNYIWVNDKKLYPYQGQKKDNCCKETLAKGEPVTITITGNLLLDSEEKLTVPHNIPYEDIQIQWRLILYEGAE